MNKKKKFGILGGAGFIGSFLIPKLQHLDYEIKIGDLKDCEVDGIPVTEIDVCDVESISKLGKVDCIINLAAVHRDDVKPISKYEEVNVGGASAVCDFAEKMGVSTIVFTSSVAIYGFAPPNTGEDGNPNYFNEYGRTKFLAEKVYIEWFSKDPCNRSLVIVRPTVVFGPGNRGNVYNLLNQIASKKFAMFGDGTNIKSMAYVDNVAGFLKHCTNLGPGKHIFNYIDKPDLNMNDLVSVARKTLFNKRGVGIRLPKPLGIMIGLSFDLLSRILNKSLPVSSIRVKKFMSTTQFSSAADQTGFIPLYSLSEGLKKTLRYEFIEDNSHKPTFETE